MASPVRRDSDQFNLRMPDGMRERLKDAAEANNRSMNAEIVSRLEASFRYEADYKIEEDALKDISNYHREQLAHVQSELEFASAYQKNLNRRLLVLKRDIDLIEDGRKANGTSFKGPERA